MMCSYWYNKIKKSITNFSPAVDNQQLISDPNIPDPSIKSYYFADFSKWQIVFELIVTSNLLAIAITLLKAESFDYLSSIDFIKTIIFVNWVMLIFAVSIDALKPFLLARSRPLAYFISFAVLEIIIFCFGMISYGLLAWAEGDSVFVFSEALLQVLIYCLLGGLFGCMIFRYIYIRERWIDQRQAELVARLQALQARIQPHFLFNSLNSVVSLIAVSPQKAEQMLIDLSSLFRASLGEFKLISLTEEIDFCRHYLAIEKQRLGDRLQVLWQLPEPEQCDRVTIPKMMLQPLLENAIYHGVETLSKPSSIAIEIEVRQNKVLILIRNSYQEHADKRESHGLAIKNVKMRLKAYYNNRATFLVTEQNGFFVTRIEYEF